MNGTFIIGNIPVSDTSVPLVSTMLKSEDYLGAVMVRWGINRDNYLVSPELYAVGSPGPTSDVFVTANYKLSFDTLRKNPLRRKFWQEYRGGT